jgi:Head domain of trimeric autotransporter adhesin/Chaperone of endosialidase
MKIIAALLFLLAGHQWLIAQNVGIGTSEPANKMHIVGNLLVNTPTSTTSTAPTGVQTKTIINASTINFLAGDSTGRIYDPGGPAANYLANLLGFVNIPLASGAVGIEITAETMGLGTGDSLIIKETFSSTNYLLAVGNGYTTTGKWVINSSSLYIIFKSNADASTGIGFSLLFKRLYDNSASLPDVSGATGTALFFDSKNGSFRSGLINNAALGIYSTAMGISTTASGDYSTGLGSYTTASGYTSTTMGYNTIASGGGSTAMGGNTTAGGGYSTAMGYLTIASGNYSTAMGRQTTASGDYSATLGKYTDATGYASTAIGDSSLASGTISFASGFRTTASGDYSTAMGYNTTASEAYSTAMGAETIASGYISTAMGSQTTASGFSSTAMGAYTIASGDYSTAMGRQTTASGDHSTAMGTFTTASGHLSTAMGSYVSTNNQEGCFVIGDNSVTTTNINSPAPNNFRARFANGYRLYTSANLSTSCSLGAGDNAWTTGSDVRTKENFAEVNGEDFLKKIAGFHLTSWNYKTQNPKTFRHYGPMAQDFYAAFGKDKYGTIGNDTTINSADFAGVSFIAIQALEKRTQKFEQLEKENEALKTMLLQLKKEVDALKGIKTENL